MWRLSLAGLTLLSIIAVPAPDPESESKTNEYIAMGLVLFGKFWITVSFASVFLYSAEIYPTVVRTTGMGTSSTCARFGGMACGWIALLSVRERCIFPLSVFVLSRFFLILAFFLESFSPSFVPSAASKM